MNSVERTVLFANLTSDTTNGAVRNYILTHILGGALYFYFLLSGQQLDDVLRASGNAFAAGNTFIFINYCNTVNDFDCAEGTSLLTTAQTQTAIGAGFCTLTCKLNSHVTIVNAEIIVFIFCFIASTTALYESGNGFSRGSCNTHDSANLFSNCCATNGAGIYRSCTGNDCRCTTTTTGETTTTAVSAGQTFQNLTDTRVFFNLENFTRNAQASAENNAHTADTQNGK